MFSPNIQNYINTSGRASALARVKQLSARIGYTEQVEADNKTNGAQGNFADVLNKTMLEEIKTTPSENNPFSLDLPPVLSNTKFGNLITSGATLDKIQAASEVSKVQKTSPIAEKPSISNTSGNYTKEQILGLVEKISNKYGVDEKLVQAVIKQESGYNPKAKSHAGALGLMQLMPTTAKSLGVKDPLNPAQNIEGGVKYLKSMLEEFNGNTILALAAYNAGPNAVKKYGTVPPYKETQNYVKSILKNYL